MVVSGYDGPERRSGSDATSVRESIDEWREWVEEQLKRFITKDDLDAFAKQNAAMVRDAIESAMHDSIVTNMYGEFSRLYEQKIEDERREREAEREQRRAEMRQFFKRTYLTIAGVVTAIVPVLAVVNYVGNWIGWW